MVNIKKIEVEVKKNFLHIAFSENELNDIKKYSKDIGITRSEFLREAIRDKVMRIEHPEAFNSKSTIDIKSILEKISDNKENNKIILEKLDVITKMQYNLKILNSIVNTPIIAEKEQKIIELLKKRKVLKPREISDLLTYSIEDVYRVISNEKKFSVDIISERIKLNE